MDVKTNFISSIENFYLLCLGLDNDDDYASFMIVVDGWTSLSV